MQLERTAGTANASPPGPTGVRHESGQPTILGLRQGQLSQCLHNMSAAVRLQYPNVERQVRRGDEVRRILADAEVAGRDRLVGVGD